MTYSFTLNDRSSNARAGTLVTSYGTIKTPVFMPVGTRASVKMIGVRDLEEIGVPIILGNTYHLSLRPGEELIAKIPGNLHGFMSWNHPILTDSGGYQVFSLDKINKKTEEGVLFSSHIDGSPLLLTPERSMNIQRSLGSDIVMCFDDCPSLPSTEKDLRKSMELTLRWAERCTSVVLQDHQNLFGIIQGGLDIDLRRECLARMGELKSFAGFAIGGLSVGEKNDEMKSFCQEFIPSMPVGKPRYLMGVGKPMDILHGVKVGIDMFDCVLPTRNARNGQFFTKYGPLNIKKVKFKEDLRPPDPDCLCSTCRIYSRSYIRHLYKVGEPLAGYLISYHNLYFYQRMMESVRDSILKNLFDVFFTTFYKDYSSNRWQED